MAIFLALRWLCVLPVRVPTFGIDELLSYSVHVFSFGPHEGKEKGQLVKYDGIESKEETRIYGAFVASHR